ncbi:nucleic-acid-binding protein from transposon x-element [Lasius niger]|uniref:Nucleic-acid-binding protein from transposon x-element n=1 Tax=Lasius niger TaxID=67767 RepID=A0A0J7JXH4_LASNI|nr:nucleic-acid-binding protein from transposon x-element [Lasius niger]
MLSEDMESGNQTEWHIFTDKNTRPFNVMARGLDPATGPRAIIQDMETKGFKIISATNILKTEFKKSPCDEKKTIKTQVKLTRGGRGPGVTELKECQGFNHVRSSCHRKARCVKCAGEHPTEACLKPADAKPKCANCGEAHSANYRGCAVAKELQKRRNKTINNKKQDGLKLKKVVKDRQRELEKKPTGKKQNCLEPKHDNSTYAEKSKQSNSKSKEEESKKDTLSDPIIAILEKLMDRLDQHENLTN